ncbi:unnamed protein product [Trichobilharzia regenti]|nr:unnamed protein product [Trichobilharzia regenti]
MSAVPSVCYANVSSDAYLYAFLKQKKQLPPSPQSFVLEHLFGSRHQANPHADFKGVYGIPGNLAKRVRMKLLQTPKAVKIHLMKISSITAYNKNENIICSVNATYAGSSIQRYVIFLDVTFSSSFLMLGDSQVWLTKEKQA